MTYRDLIIVIASISYTPSRSHGLRANRTGACLRLPTGTRV